MKIFKAQTIRSNCIACMAAVGQPARSGINLFLTIALSAVLLAACGGGGGGNSDPAPGGLPGVSDLKIIPAEGSFAAQLDESGARRYPRLQYQLGEYESARIRLGADRGSGE